MQRTWVHAKLESVVTPGLKPQGTIEDDEALGEEASSRFRALAARATYLAQYRPYMQSATKELCREMSAPTVRAWKG